MKGQKGKALVFTVALENSQTLYYNRNMKKVNRYLITIFLCLVAFVLAGLFLLGCETTPDDSGNVNNEVFNVLYTTDGNGTVQGEAEQTVPYGGSAATVTAVPNAGYKFVKWSDTGSDNPVRTDENITNNLTATAEFEKIKITVTYNADEGGTIDGVAVQEIEYGGSAATVTAVPNAGYKFVKWSDTGSDNPVRTDENVTDNLTATAEFKKLKFKITYLSNNFGKIEGEIVQNILFGDEGVKVKAVPYDGFVFLYWSDGNENAERIDKCLTQNMTVTAYFGCEVNYKVNNVLGGKVLGKTEQKVLRDEMTESVKAVPNDGYIFTGWSDMSYENVRNDSTKRSINYVAYFELKEKRLKYDYGFANGMPTDNEITIYRDNLTDIQFIIPSRDGYKFCGWFIDKELTFKAIDEDGKYMLGYYAFAMDGDTLYAKWEKENIEENIPIHKILLVFVDRIEANLYSTVDQTYVDVNYKMSGVEYDYFSFVSVKLSKYLNMWFDGIAKFEVDSFFTLTTVGTESFSSGMTFDGNFDYGVYPNDIPEIYSFLPAYHNIISYFGMNDFDYKLHMGSGTGQEKYGCVNIESRVYGLNLPVIINDLKSGGSRYELGVISTVLHEFTHTCEMNYKSNEILEFHSVDISNIYVVRDYLLGKAESRDGVVGGIPLEYWKHENKVFVGYLDEPIDGRSVGKTLILNEEIYGALSSKVDYGTDISAQAVPNVGYKFLMWSDGVTTAIRNDTNVISYLLVKAIFIKDN